MLRILMICVFCLVAFTICAPPVEAGCGLFSGLGACRSERVESRYERRQQRSGLFGFRVARNRGC